MTVNVIKVIELLEEKIVWGEIFWRIIIIKKNLIKVFLIFLTCCKSDGNVYANGSSSIKIFSQIGGTITLTGSRCWWSELKATSYAVSYVFNVIILLFVKAEYLHRIFFVYLNIFRSIFYVLTQQKTCNFKFVSSQNDSNG